MTQAVLEGVTFALRDSLEIARGLNADVSRIRLCGGGAKSPLWRTIAANIFQCPVEILQTEEGPAMGSAILAMVAAGEYNSVEQAAAQLLRLKQTVEPDPVLMDLYQARWELFRLLYPAQKDLYARLADSFAGDAQKGV